MSTTMMCPSPINLLFLLSLASAPLHGCFVDVMGDPGSEETESEGEASGPPGLPTLGTSGSGTSGIGTSGTGTTGATGPASGDESSSNESSTGSAPTDGTAESGGSTTSGTDTGEVNEASESSGGELAPLCCDPFWSQAVCDMAPQCVFVGGTDDLCLSICEDLDQGECNASPICNFEGGKEDTCVAGDVTPLDCGDG